MNVFLHFMLLLIIVSALEKIVLLVQGLLFCQVLRLVNYVLLGQELL